MPDFLAELERIVGPGGLVTGEDVHARPTSYWDPSPTNAIAVVRPASTEQTSAVLSWCHSRGQPIVTQGGRTGCVQGGDVRGNEIVLSTERINAIEQIGLQGATAIVQAGALLQNVQQAAAEAGLLFPLDFGARGSCTIGGNIATNAGGINVLRYGMARHLVLGLEAVLADGTIVSSMNRMIKNNAGYDLKQLFIGSEGTLGVVTRAVLRLFPLPSSRNTALVALENFEQVSDLLQHCQRDLGGSLSAYEVMWGEYFAAVTKPGGHVAPLDRDHSFYVILETEGGDSKADEVRFLTVLESALSTGLIVDAVVPKSETERAEIWGIRENFEAITEGGAYYLYDVSLPIPDMPEYVESVLTGLLKTWPGSECYVFGHIADGNLHIFVKPNREGELHEQSDEIVYRPLSACEGSVSAEHGIGIEKRPWLSHCRSESELALMATLKQVLDPKGILNPGRVLSPEKDPPLQ